MSCTGVLLHIFSSDPTLVGWICLIVGVSALWTAAAINVHHTRSKTKGPGLKHLPAFYAPGYPKGITAFGYFCILTFPLKDFSFPYILEICQNIFFIFCYIYDKELIFWTNLPLKLWRHKKGGGRQKLKTIPRRKGKVKGPLTEEMRHLCTQKFKNTNPNNKLSFVK